MGAFAGGAAVSGLVLAAPLLMGPTVLAAPIVNQDLIAEARKGRELSPAHAEDLERQLAESPQSLGARAQLLGYYHRHGRLDNDAHARHLVWFIRNAPEAEVLGGPHARISTMRSPDGYLAAKREWLRLIEDEPDAVVLLGHAAHFFAARERALAVSLLTRAEAVEPTNPDWARRLGQLRWREARAVVRELDSAEAARALADFERAHELSGVRGRADLMPDLAVTAFAAGDHTKARSYAQAMLDATSADENAGDYLHYGNLVLGRIALAEDNLKEAAVRLLAAGRTRGAPLNRAPGPDMALARALLEHGDSRTVLGYLELCLQLWEAGAEDLRDWIVLIQAGLIPDFGHKFLF